MRQIIAFGAILSALGCGHTSEYVGSWEGKRDVQTAPGVDPAIVESLTKVTLTVHENGRFDLFDHGLPMAGEIGSEDGKDVLRVQSVVGRQPNGSYGNDYALQKQPDGSLKLGTVDSVLLAPAPKPGGQPNRT